MAKKLVLTFTETVFFLSAKKVYSDIIGDKNSYNLDAFTTTV